MDDYLENHENFEIDENVILTLKIFVTTIWKLKNKNCLARFISPTSSCLSCRKKYFSSCYSEKMLPYCYYYSTQFFFLENDDKFKYDRI